MMRAFSARLFVVMFCAGLSRLALADGTAPDLGQARTLGRQLETAVQKGDGAAAGALFDIDGLIDRSTAGVTAPQQLATSFRQGLKMVPSLPKQLALTAKGGNYRFLRARQVGGESRVLFRLFPPQGGVNYHDWVVGADGQGQLKLVDVYVATTGELMSQTLRRAYVMVAAHANPTLLERLTGRERDFINNLKTVAQLAGNLRANNWKGVLDAYATLPKSLQEDKSCMLMRLTAAEHLRKERHGEYESAMADFARHFPGDPCLDMVCLDGLIEQKQFDQARQSLDRLKTFTGGDPYLGVLRGNIDMDEGGPANFKAARNEFETAKIVEPTLAKAYWALVTLDLKTNDYDKAAAELTEIERTLHIPVGPLEGKPLYAGFVQSEAYKKWKAAQGGGK